LCGQQLVEGQPVRVHGVVGLVFRIMKTAPVCARRDDPVRTAHGSCGAARTGSGTTGFCKLMTGVA